MSLSGSVVDVADFVDDCNGQMVQFPVFEVEGALPIICLAA